MQLNQRKENDEIFIFDNEVLKKKGKKNKLDTPFENLE